MLVDHALRHLSSEERVEPLRGLRSLQSDMARGWLGQGAPLGRGELRLSGSSVAGPVRLEQLQDDVLAGRAAGRAADDLDRCVPGGKERPLVARWIQAGDP